MHGKDMGENLSLDGDIILVTIICRQTRSWRHHCWLVRLPPNMLSSNMMSLARDDITGLCHQCRWVLVTSSLQVELSQRYSLQEANQLQAGDKLSTCWLFDNNDLIFKSTSRRPAEGWWRVVNRLAVWPYWFNFQEYKQPASCRLVTSCQPAGCLTISI